MTTVRMIKNTALSLKGACTFKEKLAGTEKRFLQVSPDSYAKNTIGRETSRVNLDISQRL